jgi:hypothetical protein
MAAARFHLNFADKSGVEQTAEVGNNPIPLLRDRDERRRNSNPRVIHWRVFDTDDPELGDVEWCEYCARGWGHGALAECSACRQLSEEQVGS